MQKGSLGRLLESASISPGINRSCINLDPFTVGFRSLVYIVSSAFRVMYLFAENTFH